MIKRNRWAATIAVVFTLLISACGGGGGGAAAPPATPPAGSDWDTMQWDNENWS